MKLKFDNAMWQGLFGYCISIQPVAGGRFYVNAVMPPNEGGF